MPQNELKKASSEEDKLKIIVVAVVVTLCVAITLYFRIVGVEVVYTHFFYIPIGLASFWFGKKGFFVALILALVLLLTHLTVDQLFLNNVMRAFMFCIVGFAVGILSEARNKAENELKKYSERLEEKVEERTRELRESEERFRTIFETAQDFIFIKDRTLKYTQINLAMEKLFGVPAPELIGKTDDDLFDKESASHLRGIDSRVLKGEIVEEEHTKKVKGIPFTFHIIKVPMRNASGEIIGLCGIARDITERKRVEEMLKSERDKLQALIGGLARTEIGIDIVGIDYKVLFQNRTLKEKFGDLSGKLCYEMYMGLKKPCDFCPMERAIKSNKAESVELTAVDGRNYVLLSAPLPNPDGTVDKVIEVIRDITEYKRAERELQESKNKIEQLHKVAVQMEAVQSEEEVYQLTVDTAEKILQFNICEVYMVEGDKLVVKAASSDMPLAGGQDMSINEGIAGKTYRTSGSYLTEDIKEEKEARPSIDEYRSGISIPIGKFGVFQAISTKVGAFNQEDLKMGELLISHTTEALKRIRSEKALQESEEKYRSLTNQLPVGVYRTTEEGKLLHANPALATILEFESVEDFMKVSASDVYNDPRERINQIKQWKTTKEIISNELKFRTKKGREIWIRDTGHAILDENGEISYIDGVIEDITDRKKAEELLKKQRKELSAFAHTVSHDLKNYIGIIRNSAQFSLLKKEYAEKNNQRIIDMTKKMENFVNRQLELADAGKAIGELEEIDLNKMIDEVRKTHSIEIHTEELSMIKGDSQRLKEVFHNLIDNAIKHGKADRIEISSIKKKDSCIICVKDNGKGISGEDIDNIFNMGYSKIGTGFGLTIVKKIIEAHDGSISVKSRERKGTTFEIVLPSRE
jgi:PAS domain S-box-containing protein